MAITRPGEVRVGTQTWGLASGIRATDVRDMASLPALPSFGRLRRDKHDAATATELVAQVDAKLTLARRLRDEDQARRATSVAPPSQQIRA
jgi:hypothetical protein